MAYPYHPDFGTIIAAHPSNIEMEVAFLNEPLARTRTLQKDMFPLHIVDVSRLTLHTYMYPEHEVVL